MFAAFCLLSSVAVLGALDTAYYHEWRARLPALGPRAATELRLHAARDLVYAAIFIVLPFFVWHGTLVWVPVTLLAVEIVLTLWDFVVEDWIRKPLGGVYPGERIMHAVIGILYGAMLAMLAVPLHSWSERPTALIAATDVAPSFQWTMIFATVLVSFSGLRDLCAAAGIRGSAWPWSRD